MSGLDTADKRASAMLVSLPFRAVLPQPGTLTAGDRPELAFLYRGIADVGGVTPPTPGSAEWIIRARRRGRR